MAVMSKRHLTNAPLLDAAARKTPSRPAVWFMRQAGRTLPEYLTARAGITMLDSCSMPERLAEVTLRPVRRHDFDASILFSAIVVPPRADATGVAIVAGGGPVMAKAVRTRSD